MQTQNSVPTDIIKEVGYIQNKGFVVGVTVANRCNKFCLLVTAISENIFDRSWIKLKSLSNILNSEISLAFDSNVAAALENLVLHYKSVQDSNYMVSVDKNSTYRTKCTAATSVSNGSFVKKQLYLSILECATKSMYLFEIEEDEYSTDSARNAMHAPSKCQVLLSNNFLNRINRSPSVEEVTKMFCNAAMEILRYSCRVMAIKFLNDGSGKIVTEVIRDPSRDTAPSACGSTLPAEVFKEPEHYQRNQWRFVYDIDECEVTVYSSQCDSLDLKMSKFVTAAKPAKIWIRSLGARSVLALVIDVNDTAWGVYTIHSKDRLVVPTREQSVLLESVASLSAIRIASIAREDHFARMAHEVRNPLHGIISALQILKSETSSPTPTQITGITDCSDIIDCAVKSSEVIIDILNSSINIQTHSDSKYSLEPLNLYGVLASVVQILKPIAMRKSLKLELIDGDLSDSASRELVVLGEEFRIVQIANNFVSNAIKFTSMKGSITVRSSYVSARHIDTLWNNRKNQYAGSNCEFRGSQITRSYEDSSSFWVVLEVEDTGCGVSEANMHIMFEAFEQLSVAGKRHCQLQGDGLGLHIVKMHVEAMDGILCVASTEGSGTLMFCAFPATRANLEIANSSGYVSTKTVDSNLVQIYTADSMPTLDTLNSQDFFFNGQLNVIAVNTQTCVALPTIFDTENKVVTAYSNLDSKKRNVTQTSVSPSSQSIFEVGIIQNHGFVIGLKVCNAEDIRVIAVNQEILLCSWVNPKTLSDLLNSKISTAFDSVIANGLSCLLSKKQCLKDGNQFFDSLEGTASMNSSSIPKHDIIMRSDVTLLFEDLHLSLSIVDCSTPDIYLFEVGYIVEFEDQSRGNLAMALSRSNSSQNLDSHNHSRTCHIDITSGKSKRSHSSTVSLLDITGIFCDTAMDVLPDCDRVWCLRMLSDGSAEIIDERIRDTIVSFTASQLGKKYAADMFNDNELYLSSGFRVTYDIEKPHTKVFGYNIQDLDLRKCKLCVIREACLSRCRQMGIRTSLTISVQVDGRLWGLYSIHSINRPMLPSYWKCLFLEAVATDSAFRIAAITREEFISHMSHELRTPIHGITCALQILQSTIALPSQNDCVDVIDCAIQSSQAMVTAINDILTIARATRRHDKVMQPFNIYDAVTSVTQGFESISGEKSIQFTQLIVVDDNVVFHKASRLTVVVHNPRMKEFNVFGDATRKVRVLQIFLTNAFKFTPAEGSVILRVSCVSPHRAKEILNLAANTYENNYKASTLDSSHITSSVSSCWLVFEVHDTGCGIAGDSMNTIFDAYQQLSCGVRKIYQGIGLGLHVARLHTEMMGGLLGVTSTNEIGSLFYCAFPVQLASISHIIENVYSPLSKKRPIASVTNSLDGTILSPAGASEPMKVPCNALQSNCRVIDSQSSPNCCVGGVIISQPEESKNNTSTFLTNCDSAVNGNNIVLSTTWTGTRRNENMVIFLAVDDSPFNLKLLVRKIELSIDKKRNISVKCLTATNGSIAVNMYKTLIDESKHRLLAGIFMDYHMPLCDGAEAIALIRAIEQSLSLRRVHIVAFTADVSEASHKCLLERGADEVMPKPTPPGLIENICQLLVQQLPNDV